MKKMVFSLFLALVCLNCATSAADFVLRTDESIIQHGARIDATMTLLYDSFKSSNDVYLYGGRGYNMEYSCETFMDPRGEVWKGKIIRIQKDDDGDYIKTIEWVPCRPDQFQLTGNGNDEVPGMRYGHCAVLCPTTNAPINPDSVPVSGKEHVGSKNNINYIVFGGKCQVNSSDYTTAGNSVDCNDLWVLAQYQMTNVKPMESNRYHWYKLTPQGDTPPARSYAQAVPLFNSQTPINERTQFLLFGGESGVDPNRTILNDLYLVTFERDMDYQLPASNEWSFDMGLSVTFDEITLDSDPNNEDVEVTGASVVYDPYYGDDGQNGIEPRVIITGGSRKDGGNIVESDQVIILYPTTYSNGSWSWATIDSDSLTSMGAGNARREHTAVLNIRDHKLRVFGGEEEDGTLNTSLIEMDLTQSSLSWSTPATVSEVNTSRHNAVFSEGTVVYRRTGSSPNYSSALYNDEDEMTFWEDEGQTWTVSKNALWGLDNPESIVNTPRIQANDIIKIQQTACQSGKVNDAFKCNLCFPSRARNATLEGVMKNGVKPVLYQNYNPDAWTYDSPETGLDDERFSRDMSEIVYCHPRMTIRNIHFCHFETDLTATDNMPTAIPSTPLEAYQELDSHQEWDFLRYHSRDPAIFVHSQITLENCEFSLNGVGITLICVSSAIEQATISNCDFNRNFMGIVSLETDHVIKNNRFYDNYLAGIALDKGSRSIVHDNYFEDNGQNFTPENTIVGRNIGAIMSAFATPYFVPLSQAPMIFNNTFYDNERALAVTMPKERAQYFNRPVFFNNIVQEDNDDDAIIVENGSGRCDVISWNNCFDVQSPIFTTDAQGRDAVLQYGIFDDPLLTGSQTLLAYNSPCIDAGLYLHHPGVLSERNYADFGEMDIGYHFPPDQATTPDPPRNLEFDDSTLEWDHPVGQTLSFMVVVETPGGDLLDFYWTSTTSYTLPTELENMNLWCGVMSHENQTVYSDPVWIEYY